MSAALDAYQRLLAAWLRDRSALVGEEREARQGEFDAAWAALSPDERDVVDAGADARDRKSPARELVRGKGYTVEVYRRRAR